jgi:hypothetical protein
MARQTLIVLLALMLIVTPTHAQAETVLLDMTIQTLPGVPSGHCLYLDAGSLAIEARLTGDNRWPVRVILTRPPDTVPSLDLQVRTPEPMSRTIEVQTGLYCYAVINGAIAEAQGVPDQSPQWEQPIAVRLTWLPAP